MNANKLSGRKEKTHNNSYLSSYRSLSIEEVRKEAEKKVVLNLKPKNIVDSSKSIFFKSRNTFNAGMKQIRSETQRAS